MKCRGSLKHCINTMHVIFNQQQYEMLSVIHCPRGKYYTVLTEKELLYYNSREKSDSMRLVCRLSRRELEQFARTVQPTLFDEEPNV